MKLLVNQTAIISKNNNSELKALKYTAGAVTAIIVA